MDLASLYDRILPTELLAFNYNGVLSDSFFVEAQYSEQQFTFENSGSIYTDLINGTLLLDRAAATRGTTPRRSAASATPEKRDNEDILVKGTYFLSTKGLGLAQHRRRLRRLHRQAPLEQPPVGQRLPHLRDGRRPPGVGRLPDLQYGDVDLLLLPAHPRGVPGEQRDSPVRVPQRHLAAQQQLLLQRRRPLRQEPRRRRGRRRSPSTTDAFSPRLAATWDVKGDGKLRVTANYAKYVAGIQEGQAGSGYTPAGAPASYYWYYNGFGATPINTGTGPYLTSEQALTQLWNWFRAQGCLSDFELHAAGLRGLQDPAGRGPERSRRQPADPGLPRFAVPRRSTPSASPVRSARGAASARTSSAAPSATSTT